MRICCPGRFGLGGPRSFQRRLQHALGRRGVDVVTEWESGADAVLLLGGTRSFARLLRYKRRGTPIIQRVDGMNWLHRARWPGPRDYLMAEARNRLLFVAYRRFADAIVFQSEFVREWWRSVVGREEVPSTVIYNGVDLRLHAPEGDAYRSARDLLLLIMEGNIGEDQLPVMEAAVAGAERLAAEAGLRAEVLCAGVAGPDVQACMRSRVRFLGPVEPGRVPFYQRGADLYVSLDINAACPNTAIEVLACGTPVTGYATGALPELIREGGGVCAPYGGDPWNFAPPDQEALTTAMSRALAERYELSVAARRVSRERFDLDHMAELYIDFIERIIDGRS